MLAWAWHAYGRSLGQETAAWDARSQLPAGAAAGPVGPRADAELPVRGHRLTGWSWLTQHPLYRVILLEARLLDTNKSVHREGQGLEIQASRQYFRKGK